MRGLKKLHEKGTEYIYIHRRTSQLLDQLGPEGRVGENDIKHVKICTHEISARFPCFAVMWLKVIFSLPLVVYLEEKRRIGTKFGERGKLAFN